MYLLLSKLYPKGLKEGYKRLLKSANINVNLDRFIGFVLFVGAGLALAITFYLGKYLDMPLWVIWVLLFLGIETTLYMWLNLKVNKKIKEIEKALPDALQLMSSNLRAGLTPDKAFLLAARPEFGVFKDEINRVGREITVGKTLEMSLINMSQRINSEKIEKVVLLIISGIKSGGELADLLEETARNTRNQDLMEQKIKSSVLSYVIFIFAAVAFGAPILFGLSSFLVEVLKQVFSQIDIPASAAVNIPIKISKISISTDFIVTYSIVSLVATSILSSLLIGGIVKGRGKEGFKYIPIMILITLVMFFTCRSLISGLLEI